VESNTVAQRLRDVLPRIRARRQEIEEARRIPRDLIDSIAATGVFRMTVPRAIGGDESPPVDVLRVIETAAAADGSTGWCVMNALGCNVAGGYMDEGGAREIFTDPGQPSAGIAAPAGAAVRDDGGFRVSGRWPFASGITHCPWIWAGCLVMEGGKPRMTDHGPQIVHAWMPVREVQIIDTWHVSGLRGTGSFDFSVQDRFVPDRHIFALLDPAGHRKEPLYQMPPLGLYTYKVACVALGIARAALDELAEIAPSKVPTLYTAPLAERAVAQTGIARAEAALGAARAFLFETVEAVWETVKAGRTPSPRQLALARAATTQAAEIAADTARTAAVLAGGSAIYDSSAFQRHARDAEALTHHFTVAPHVWEQAGRVLLGRDPGVPAF